MTEKCAGCGGKAGFLCRVCRGAFCTARGCLVSGAHHPCSVAIDQLVANEEMLSQHPATRVRE